MHFAVDLDVFNYFVAVGFESAVKVVQVLDTAHLTRCGVEEFGGDGFRQRVVAFLLVARHEVVALDGNHAEKFGYFVGRIL